MFRSLLFVFFLFSNAMAQNTPTASIYDIDINDLDGDPISLSDYKDKFIMFVNVASECGFTRQYEGLQKLYEEYSDSLMIIGVPCNQFGGQEPGTAEEIQSFCKTNYGVTFVMTEKIEVKGAKKHPLYQWLTDKSINGISSSSVKWNFQKYLINSEGHLVGYYYAITKPLSKKITKHLN